MTDPPSLEAILIDLAEHIDWPVSDVAPQVAARLSCPDSARRAGPVLARPSAALIGATVLVAVLTPWGRSAVASLLGVGGVEIRWVHTAELPAAATIDLGRPATVEDVARRVDFTALMPHDPVVGPPSGIFIADTPPGGRVDMLWATTSRLPAIGDTDVGMLYTQFAHGDTPWYSKEVLDGTSVLAATVRGGPAYWIEGDPHVIRPRDSGLIEDGRRLATNVLLWQEGRVTHRLEATITLDEAQRIASTMRVLDPSG